MIYVFGDCELDDERCELWRAGAMVTVEPKVLAHLIVHRDRVVTKDEFLERFWPGTFVSESALTRCLTKVRQAVHDDRLSQRVIRTVRGHGYRFVAEVSACGRVPTILPAQANTPASPPLPSAPIRLAADGPTTHGVLPMEHKDVTALVAGLRGATTLAQAVAAEVLHDTLQRALALGEALGMRPLLAHCHLSIGTLYAHMGWNDQAQTALSGAIELYRSMVMTCWLAGAEVVLAQMV